MTAKEKLTNLANAFRNQTGKTNSLSIDKMTEIAATPNFLIRHINNKQRPSDGNMIINAEDVYGITAIKERMFDKTYFINKFILPNTVTRIDGYAFRDCGSLQYIYLPASITTFGTTPFSGSALEEADVHCNVSGDVFFGSENLHTVKIREEVTEIGGACFMKCYALNKIIVYGNRVCTLNAEFAFGDNTIVPDSATPIKNGTGYIYVPSHLVEDYKAATNWSLFAD